MPVMVLGAATKIERMDRRRPAADPVLALVLEVALAPRKARSLAGNHVGLRIRCAGAPLWITQENDPDDYRLEPGEQFTVTRPGLVVLQGLEC